MLWVEPCHELGTERADPRPRLQRAAAAQRQRRPDVLHGDDTVYAALLSAQAVGGIAGAFVVGRFFGGASARMLLATGAVIFGLIDLALFLFALLDLILQGLLIKLIPSLFR